MQVVFAANAKHPNTVLSTTVVTAAESSVNRKAQGLASSVTYWCVSVSFFVLLIILRFLFITSVMTTVSEEASLDQKPYMKLRGCGISAQCKHGHVGVRARGK